MKKTSRIAALMVVVVGTVSLVWPGPVRADSIVPDDLIIQGGVCVGVDCADGEAFGNDVLRLKGPTLRIHFDDTSTVGQPLNDWRILINGTIGGDPSYFAIEDSTAGLIPFAIAAGAPQATLFMASTGSVGIKTTAPAKDLHLTADSSPTIRLEQNDGMFPGYVYDIFANEFSFGVSDENALTTPFQILAGAPHNSLHISGSGKVGFGVGTPAATIDAQAPAASGVAEVLAKFGTSDDASGKLFIVNNSAANGVFIPKILGRSAGQNAALINEALITNDAGASPAIVYNAAKGAGGALAVRPLVVYRNNGVARATIAANGDINATSFNPTSSREMKEDIEDLDAASAAEAIKTLTPVKYVYKDDETREPRVGFIAEDVPDLVSNADRKSVPIMDVVALVTRVVKDQQATIDSQRVQLEEQKRANEEQKRVNEELLKRLSALEAKMQN